MVASIRNSTLRNVIIGPVPTPPPVLLDAYGYFNVTNSQPEPGIYPTFGAYPALPDSGFLNSGPNLQSGDPTDAVGSLTTAGTWNGDDGIGVGTGVAIDIQPMPVSTIRSYSYPFGNIASFRFYFPMLSTDTVYLVARTGSGDNGFGFYTAGTMTIVVGPSATEGERYLISWPDETAMGPSLVSVERLTDIGPRP